MVQRAPVCVHVQQDIAALSAAASGGSTVRHILLPTEGDAAVPAIAPIDVDLRLVIEHGQVRIPSNLWEVKTEGEARQPINTKGGP
jgi:hypothetical protein